VAEDSGGLKEMGGGEEEMEFFLMEWLLAKDWTLERSRYDGKRLRAFLTGWSFEYTARCSAEVASTPEVEHQPWPQNMELSRMQYL